VSATHEFYNFIGHWCREKLRHSTHTTVIGINGPQGSGKTTLGKFLTDYLNQNLIPAISLSIDDFYYDRSTQSQIARENLRNPFLQQRGYPGTHDIELGTETLRNLKLINEHGSEVLIPVYDKSKHQGKGDRLGQDDWRKVVPPLMAIIFEGWMLGYQPATSEFLNEWALRTSSSKEQLAALTQINKLLRAYGPWTNELGLFIMLDPVDHEYALKWRVEAEERMAASGKPAMSKDEVEKYISLFMPAYEVYLPELRKFASRGENRLKVEIGLNRLPLHL
jgi:D-glycerate 3-kinase